MTLPKLFKTLAASLTAAAAVAALPALLTGCDNGCEQTRENYLHIAFSPTSGRTLRSVTLYYLKDNTWYQSRQETAFTDIQVYLNPHDTQTTLKVECSFTDYGDSFSTTDDVQIQYTSTARFLDMNCGCTIDYDLTGVTTTHELLANAIINDAQVRPDGGINITFEY